MINLDNAKEGMIVSEDVLNNKGSILMKKGIALTADMIKKLKSLGIMEVCVVNTDKDDSQDNVSPEPMEMEELEHKFSDVRDDAIMEELMAAVKEYITERGCGNDPGQN
ncbi:unnamed protein product [marine sediment metagenome]|uniref:Uncharacterized protein n=1 Tax=marine sediment metagenome TaxID=412755 RepID=X0VX66_9ZZZZ